MFLALNVRVYHFYIALGQGFLKNAPANSVSILIVQKKQRYVTLHPSMEGFTSLSAESCLLPLLARSYRTINIMSTSWSTPSSRAAWDAQPYKDENQDRKHQYALRRACGFSAEH